MTDNDDPFERFANTMQRWEIPVIMIWLAFLTGMVVYGMAWLMTWIGLHL